MFYNRSTRVEIIRKRKNEYNRVRSTMNILDAIVRPQRRVRRPRWPSPYGVFFPASVSFFLPIFHSCFFRPPLCRAQTSSRNALAPPPTTALVRPSSFFSLPAFIRTFSSRHPGSSRNNNPYNTCRTPRGRLSHTVRLALVVTRIRYNRQSRSKTVVKSDNRPVGHAGKFVVTPVKASKSHAQCKMKF